MASVTVKVDISQKSLEHAVNYAEGTKSALVSKSSQIARAANSMSSGFRTGFYHRDHKSPAIGGTSPVYSSDVKMGRKGYVGIVHPSNYAAMKDNHQNNTLLKAKG